MSALRVLHVDDEPDIRELVEMSLSLDPELSVKSCASGADALDAATKWSPDLILIDVMMPVMDGPQTLAHLREHEETAEIPVVFMTARAQARELAQFLSLGAAGVIPKPFDPMTLAGSVKQYIGARTPDAAQLKRRFVAQAKGDAGKLGDCRGKIGIDSATAFSRIERIAHALAEAGARHDFIAVGSAASVLARMVEEAENGIGSVRDVESAIDQLVAAIDRDCRDGDDVKPNVRLA